jgi:hypothetical protein
MITHLLVDLHTHCPLCHVPHHARLAVVVLVRHALHVLQSDCFDNCLFAVGVQQQSACVGNQKCRWVTIAMLWCSYVTNTLEIVQLTMPGAAKTSWQNPPPLVPDCCHCHCPLPLPPLTAHAWSSRK